MSIVMPFGMLYKRMHCNCCGTRLKIKKHKRTISKRDEDYWKYWKRSSDSIIEPRSYVFVCYTYECPCCGSETTYDEQLDIRFAQKRYFKKFVTPKEINDTKCQRLTQNIQRILKARRLLWFPLIGGLICFFLAAWGEFGRQHKEAIDSIFSVTFGVLLIPICIRAWFVDIMEIIKFPQIIFYLLPLSCLFNLSMLWCIHRKIKPMNKKTEAQDTIENH